MATIGLIIRLGTAPAIAETAYADGPSPRMVAVFQVASRCGFLWPIARRFS